MTPLPPVPNVLLFRVIWEVGLDANAETLLHAAWAGTIPTTAICDTLAGQVGSLFTAEFIPLLNEANKVLEVGCVDLSVSTGAFGTASVNLPGTLTDAFLGADTAFLISYKIGRRYRGGKPRSYMPLGGAAELEDPQQWTDGFVSSTQTAAGSMLSYFSGAAAGGTNLEGLVNVSYYSGTIATPSPSNPDRYINRPVKRVTPLVDPVTSAVAQKFISSQRRRTLRRP